MAAERATRWSNGAFAAAFLVTLIFFYEVVAPFVIPVLVGAFIVVLAEPIHERLVRLVRGRRRLASLMSSLGVLLVVLIPATVVGYLAVRQFVDLLAALRGSLGPRFLEELLGGHVPAPLAPLFGRLEVLGIEEQIQGALNSIASSVTAILAGMLGATTRVVLDAFLVVVSMYYFFLDGPKFVDEVGKLSPMESRYEREFFREFRDVANAMVYVNALTAMLQGIAGAIGFLIVGLGQPLVWAVLMAFLSVVPIVGTGLVWVPAGLWLILSGRPLAGIFLLAWGTLVIGAVDNIVRPLVAKGRMRLHPLLVFVTIFGGIAAFGPVGVVLGPLVGSLFTAMIRIWKRDFVPRLLGSPTPAR